MGELSRTAERLGMYDRIALGGTSPRRRRYWLYPVIPWYCTVLLVIPQIHLPPIVKHLFMLWFVWKAYLKILA